VCVKEGECGLSPLTRFVDVCGLRPWSCRCMCVEPLEGGGMFFSLFFYME
jgi:hypothetical protein